VKAATTLVVPQSVLSIIGDLAARTLHPGWIANYAPDGVLYHHGWAAQEMPRAEAKGGYLHGIRDIVTSAPAGPAARFYNDQIVPIQSVRLAPGVQFAIPAIGDLGAIAPFSLAELYAIFSLYYYSAELLLDPASFRATYGQGNCLVYQSAIFSPVQNSFGAWESYAFTQIEAMRDALRDANEFSGAKGLEGNLYLNIGLNNNPLFFDNTLAFKFQYPQIRFKGWENAEALEIYAMWVAGAQHPPSSPPFPLPPFPPFEPGILALGLSGLPPDALMVVNYLYQYGKFPKAPGSTFTHAYPGPALDVTHPDVVRLVLRNIGDLVRSHGRPTAYASPNGMVILPAANFVIGGEFNLAYGKPVPPDPSGNPSFGLLAFQIPVDASQCRNCQPLTPYSEDLDAAFRSYLKYIVGLTNPGGGLDVDAVNARWGLASTALAFTEETQIKPSSEDWCTEVHKEALPNSQPNYKGVEDYRNFIDRLDRDLHIIQYVEAKRNAPDRSHGLHGPVDWEQAWLNSDMLQTGAWYFGQPAYYEQFGRALYYLANMVRISGKPAGFPITSPPTTESEGEYQVEGRAERRPGRLVPPPLWFNGDPMAGLPKASTTFEPRSMSREHFFFLYQDILSAGVCGIGYYRLYGFGVFDAVERDVFDGNGVKTTDFYDQTWLINDIFQEFKNEIQPKYLRFMTPYQRIALHLDSYQIQFFGAQTLAPLQPRIAGALLKYLDDAHYTYAMVSDPRVFARLFSKHSLEGSLVISPFHKDLSPALMEEYVSLVAGRPGIVVVLTDLETYGRLGMAPSRAELVGVAGSMGMCASASASQTPTWRKQAWDNAANPHVWVYVTCTEASGATELDVIEAEIEDLIQPPSGPEAIAARVTDVTSVAGVSPSEIRTNFVTDGLNYVVALTNYNQFGGASGTMKLVGARRINGYDYTVTEITSSLTVFPNQVPITPARTPGVVTQRPSGTDVEADFTLEARETKLIYFGAIPAATPFASPPTAEELRAASAAIRSALSMAFTGYDTEAGIRGLDYVDDMLAPDPMQGTKAPLERALAGLVQVSNMIFLKIEGPVPVIGSQPFRITAARLNLADLMNPAPISFADVQLIHVLNGHEEQDVPGGIGGGMIGQVQCSIGATTSLHWDFGQITGSGGHTPIGSWVANLTGRPISENPVEVHVHDAALGTQTFLLVQPSDLVLPKAEKTIVLPTPG
jgi:hypothetical protein